MDLTSSFAQLFLHCYTPFSQQYVQINLEIEMNLLKGTVGLLSIAINFSFASICVADYADEVLADNPIAYYRFEESDGDEMVLDSSGGENHSLEFENAILGAAGRVGNGVSFAGDGSILLDFDVDPSDPQGPNPFDFSIEMFVQSTAVPTQVMAAQQDGGGLGRSNLILTGGGEWGSFIGGSTTTSTITPQADQWYHLVMVYDGDFEEISYYVDGEETADPAEQQIEFADGNWVLGSHKNRDSQFVDGILDEVAFYDYRLDDPNGDDDVSDSRVLAHFSAAPILSVGCVVPDGVLAGDLDGNGEVAFADFLALSANFGSTDVPYSSGDIDCNGEVAFADFLALSANFGKTAGRAASVPEPSGLATTGILTALVIGCVRRRRS